jgi:hypothetical protein
LCRVTIDKETAKHRVAQASNFVLDEEDHWITRVYNFFEAKL